MIGEYDDFNIFDDYTEYDDDDSYDTYSGKILTRTEKAILFESTNGGTAWFPLTAIFDEDDECIVCYDWFEPTWHHNNVGAIEGDF